MTIFNRDKEETQITNFLKENFSKPKSGLMYLCGHPGTGKTSLLNQVLAKTKDFELFMYNAMTYSDVKSFCLTLHADL